MANQFIKVTPRGETEARIVLASLKPFYVSQRAKIEIPTKEEIEEAGYGERKAAGNAPANDKEKDKEIAELKRKLAAVEGKAEEEAKEHESVVEQLNETIKEQKETIGSLQEKLAANENALTETEEALSKANAELQAKAEADAKAKEGKGDK